MTIIGLDHIQLAMPANGEAEARQFYGELLGLTEMAKPEPLRGRGGCWFEGGNVQLHLGVETPFQPAKKAHPAFLVTDLAAWQAKLGAAAVTLKPDETVPGAKRFHAFDPFGNRLEFIQDGTGFSQQINMAIDNLPK